MDQPSDQEQTIKELNEYIKQLENRAVELKTIIDQNQKDTDEIDEERR